MSESDSELTQETFLKKRILNPDFFLLVWLATKGAHSILKMVCGDMDSFFSKVVKKK